MSWVRQYQVGETVEVLQRTSEFFGQHGVVRIVDPDAEGILVHFETVGGTRAQAFYDETGVRKVSGRNSGRPVSPIFYSIKEPHHVVG